MFCSRNPKSSLCITQQQQQQQKQQQQKQQQQQQQQAKPTSISKVKRRTQNGIRKQNERTGASKPTCNLTSDMLKGLKIVRKLIQRNKGSWVAKCLGSLLIRLSDLEKKDQQNQCVVRE